MASRDPLIVGRIVGDVVDYFDMAAQLRVLYGNREITNGFELRPSQVENQPTVRITGRRGSLYTLVSGHTFMHVISLHEIMKACTRVVYFKHAYALHECVMPCFR